MKFFTTCHTLEELKAEYKRLIKIHHPDLGGDNATMAQINAQYDDLAKRLPKTRADGTTYQPRQEERKRPKPSAPPWPPSSRWTGSILSFAAPGCGSPETPSPIGKPSRPPAIIGARTNPPGTGTKTATSARAASNSAWTKSATCTAASASPAQATGPRWKPPDRGPTPCATLSMLSIGRICCAWLPGFSPWQPSRPAACSGSCASSERF